MQSIITRLDLSVETEFNDGLSGGVMERLPSVIALAGPNGAGKSRLLRRVRKMAQIIPERRSRDTELATLNQQRLQRLSQSDERANKIARKMATVQSVDWDGVFESPIQVVDIDPLPRQLRSVADAKTSQVRDAGAPAPDGAFVLTEDAFWTIQSISNSYLSATHPKTKLNEIDRQWHTTRFADLNTIIRELLDTSLDPYAFDDPRLFERSLNASELSNGQQRLLAFAIAFFKAGDARTPKLVIMDEPESHLHPEAVIRVLERIKSLSGNVQIWLATHSLALLASLDPHSIWYIKSGVVSFAGNRTEDVLLSLMGGEQNIERLSTFLSSPAEFALDTFVSECVMPPAVVAPASRDPQMKEITDALCVAETRSIRVIDWGAGRGRLAATMRERQGISSENLARSVEYFAYDTSAVHREECCSAMQGLVPNPALRTCLQIA